MCAMRTGCVERRTTLGGERMKTRRQTVMILSSIASHLIYLICTGGSV